jgi:hypothetical protein
LTIKPGDEIDDWGKILKLPGRVGQARIAQAGNGGDDRLRERLVENTAGLGRLVAQAGPLK